MDHTVTIAQAEYYWLCSLAIAVRRLTEPVYNRDGRSPLEALMDMYEKKPECVKWLDATGGI